MTLVQGDVVQFNEIKNGTIGLYLTKLDSFATQREFEREAAEPSQALPF